MGFIVDAGTARRQIARHAPTLSAPAQERLVQMYSQHLLPGTLSPEPVAVDALVRISIAEGAQLYELVRSQGVASALEIGFGYGFSTIWMLAALGARPGARHIAIDPFETAVFSGVGLRQVEMLESGVDFEWIEAPSMLALPDLIRRKTQVDFVFIDSRHVFDETLAEFHLADKLLPVGGLLAIDDMWMSSLRAVISYILRNRAYERIEQPVKNLCVLRKTGEDERSWDHFAPFRTRQFRPLEFTRKWRRKLAMRS